MDDVVGPVFQLYSVPPVAVRITVSPAQIFVLLVMVVTGSGLITTVMVSEIF